MQLRNIQQEAFNHRTLFKTLTFRFRNHRIIH